MKIFHTLYIFIYQSFYTFTYISTYIILPIIFFTPLTIFFKALPKKYIFFIFYIYYFFPFRLFFVFFSSFFRLFFVFLLSLFIPLPLAEPIFSFSEEFFFTLFAPNLFLFDKSTSFFFLFLGDFHMPLI